MKTQGAPRILLADDQPDVIEALRLLLKGEGFVTEAATSPGAVINALTASSHNQFDLMLMDLNYTRDTTSGIEGLELIEQVRRFDETLPVVVMTAWGSIELAVEAMRGGSGDFIQKPWDNNALLRVVRKQVEAGRQRRREREEALVRDQSRIIELDEARRIQESLLPAKLPQISGLDLAASWQPAREVGGDYFDAIKLDEDRVALCLADIEGKGLPAAMLMANLQAVVRSLTRQSIAPARLCELVNQTMLENALGSKLISMFYGVADVKQSRLTYVNAGHLPPMLLRADSAIERLCEGGTLLCVNSNSTYHSGNIPLHRGDRLLVFTDGVTECCDGNGDEFGDERLLDIFINSTSLDAASLQQKITDALGAFSNSHFQDDVTMLVMSLE
ncbi:MAG TPA: SpoIIE family protein phosphatase [Blastocatellia bacterium]|nr:SpoIIE family protein phosphatase [Blastocatellia bacterium]